MFAAANTCRSTVIEANGCSCRNRPFIHSAGGERRSRHHDRRPVTGPLGSELALTTLNGHPLARSRRPEAAGQTRTQAPVKGVQLLEQHFLRARHDRSTSFHDRHTAHAAFSQIRCEEAAAQGREQCAVVPG